MPLWSSETIRNCIDHGTREGRAILFIDGQRGRHLQGVLQGLAVHLVRVGDGGIFAHGHDLVHLVAGVDACRHTLEVGVFQDTIVLLIAG